MSPNSRIGFGQIGYKKRRKTKKERKIVLNLILIICILLARTHFIGLGGKMAFNAHSNKLKDGGYFDDPDLVQAATYLSNFLDMKITTVEYYDLKKDHKLYEMYFQTSKFYEERCFKIVGYSSILEANITVIREPAGRWYPNNWEYRVSASGFGSGEYISLKNAVENFRRANPDYYTPVNP